MAPQDGRPHIGFDRIAMASGGKLPLVPACAIRLTPSGGLFDIDTVRWCAHANVSGLMWLAARAISGRTIKLPGIVEALQARGRLHIIAGGLHGYGSRSATLRMF